MDEYGDYKKCCHFHPTELVVGICAFCLKEKLLTLASNQSNATTNLSALPKFLNLTTLFNRTKHTNKPHSISHPCDDTSSTTPEDSFISIKFEDNGVASWDKGKISNMPLESLDNANNIKSVIEHAKPRTALRWRRRIGHVFQLIRWKRSSKCNMSHVGTKLDGGAKAKHGWIRSMTKTRTK